MRETIEDLERRRHNIAQQIGGLGDFRPGSVTSIWKKCGKTNCCCLDESHPGHGPHWRLTYKVEGKTYSESLTGDAIRKAEAEISEFRRFQQLSRDLVEVNTTICQMRSVEDESSVKKNGRRHPIGSRFRNRTVIASHIGRLTQVQPTGFGSRGNGHANRDASSGRSGFERTRTEGPTRRRRPRNRVLLWRFRSLHRDAAETNPDCRRANLYPTALLSLFPVS